MAVNWSMVAVIVAILCVPLIISPEASNRIASLWTWIRRILQPSSAVCERLLWDDIPDGLLHTGTNTIHSAAEVCFTAEHVAGLFDRAWNSPARRGKLVKKPKNLPLDKKYLQIDRMVAMALLLMTYGYYEELEERHGILLMKGGGLQMKNRPIYGVWDPLEPERKQITKAEMSLYTQGYPQFTKLNCDCRTELLYLVLFENFRMLREEAGSSRRVWRIGKARVR